MLLASASLDSLPLASMVGRACHRETPDPWLCSSGLPNPFRTHLVTNMEREEQHQHPCGGVSPVVLGPPVVNVFEEGWVVDLHLEESHGPEFRRWKSPKDREGRSIRMSGSPVNSGACAGLLRAPELQRLLHFANTLAMSQHYQEPQITGTQGRKGNSYPCYRRQPHHIISLS